MARGLVAALGFGHACAGWAAGAAQKPGPESTSLGFSALLHLSVGLLAVLALIVLSAWAYRRLAGVPRGISGALRILGGLSMGTRERIVLVQVGSEQVLVGVAPGRIQTLHVLEHPIDADTTPEPGDSRFSERLAAAIRSRRHP
ncbi:MAG: flagellar biosynthetic protein FliO [Gammaproteobacteria bacterium]